MSQVPRVLHVGPTFFGATSQVQFCLLLPAFLFSRSLCAVIVPFCREVGFECEHLTKWWFICIAQALCRCSDRHFLYGTWDLNANTQQNDDLFVQALCVQVQWSRIFVREVGFECEHQTKWWFICIAQALCRCSDGDFFYEKGFECEHPSKWWLICVLVLSAELCIFRFRHTIPRERERFVECLIRHIIFICVFGSSERKNLRTQLRMVSNFHQGLHFSFSFFVDPTHQKHDVHHLKRLSILPSHHGPPFATSSIIGKGFLIKQQPLPPWQHRQRQWSQHQQWQR